MKKLKFKIYFFVLVHITSWRQPGWLLNFWDWILEKMENRGWDDRLKQSHDIIVRAITDAMEEQDKNGTL